MLQACKPRKGNKDWQVYLASLGLAPETLADRTATIENYLRKYAVLDDPWVGSADHQALRDIHQQILRLLADGDKISSRIRARQSSEL